MTTFENLGLREEILEAVRELGFENPMPVQEQVIPFMLNDERDLIALAQTGTGKTAAFGLPILNMIEPEVKKTQALILSPTRELCMQIANDVKNYAKNMDGVKVVAVYGGENIVTQFKQLDVPPQVLVATPGRLIDLINRKKIHLENVRFLVLDEADEMLNMGFQEDLETILQSVPDERRTLLFSATMPKEIERIAQKYMRDSEEISVGTRNAGSDDVEHVYYVVQASNRYLALKRIVDMNPDIYGIVFCRTRQETKDVADKLMRDGYSADALHGDLSQAQRDTVMNKFRIKNIQILVATDVAARGLDVNNLTHVINYNLPDDAEIYTHRSGRTGRAGKKGVSISIIHTRERSRIREIEKMIKKPFKQEQVPTGMDICKRQLFAMIEKMENVQVNSEEIEPFMQQIFTKLEYLSKEDIISRFVSLAFNRFLDYYKDAPDLNVSANDRGDREKSPKGRGSRSERSERSERGDGKFRRGQKVRMKINFGERDDASPRKVLGLINKNTDDKSISINNIEISNRFTFFDVFADQAEHFMESFNSGSENGYVAEIAKDSGRERGTRERDSRDRNFSEKRRDRFPKFGKSKGGRKSSSKKTKYSHSRY